MSLARCQRPLRYLVVVVMLLGLSLPLPGSVAAQDEGTPEPDKSAPVVTASDDLAAKAVDASGAPVEYAAPTATDDVDGSIVARCDWASGAVFPLGVTTVTCTATDAAGNPGSDTFTVTVTDQTPPVLANPGNLSAQASRDDGAVVTFDVPVVDNVNGPLAASCTFPSGHRFPVGATEVICSAADATGNTDSISFIVTVSAPPATATPTPVPTEKPEPTKKPTEKRDDPTKTPIPTQETVATQGPDATSGPTEEPTETTTKEATKTETPTEAATETATAAPAATALALPWPPPDAFQIVTDGGPLGALTMMWRNEEWPISQEFGHTHFSVTHSSWYAYGRGFGLDGFEHTGLDVGMPAGTYLYSPVDGEVKIAGGVPYFTFYGNGQPGVGELMIETEDGHQVILGHMGRIAVNVGDRVKAGQFVGLSGGENGDHLHLEVRELQKGGGYRIIDPRKSFLIEAIEEAERREQAERERDPYIRRRE